MTAASIWTPNLVEQLRSLWQTEASTAEIGRRLGISKNAVVGKAHRLGLANRAAPVAARAPVVVSISSRQSCQWPVGHPGESDFHFCGSPSTPGKPYCSEHSSKAYRTVQPRSESAA